MDNFKGFGLFNNLDDEALRAFNRGRMIANIVLDNADGRKFSPKAVALSGGYLQQIPQGKERRAALDEFIKCMRKEGFELGGNEVVQTRAIEEALNV